MASFLYDEFRKSLGGNPTHSVIDFEDDTLGMFFVDEADDTPSQTADVDAADRTAAAAHPDFASAPNLVNNTATIASSILVLDANDLTFTALGAEDPMESLDLFKDSGTDTTSPFIANFDDYTGLPLTPSGTDVVVVFHANGIIRI
jgi:hypothetical protein